ncbi:MAG: DNA repair protein RecO [Caldisericia bacterium]|nr:DNA repair protein RecO [Caldisericia bacterium]
MEIIRVKGQILKKLPVKEYDALVFIYTDSLGKVLARAKSGFKKETKWISLIETMNLIDTSLYKKRDYYYLTETKVLDSFIDIKKDLNKSLLALEVLNIIDKSQIDNNPNLNLFNLINYFFNELKISNKLFELFFSFILNFFKIEGISFPLDKCIKCGKKVENHIYFDLNLNGFVCSSHKTLHYLEIDENLYKKILNLSSFSIDNITLDKRYTEALLTIIENLLISHYSFKLNFSIFKEYSII